ncbi:MAG: hypothetical protein Q9217_000224 [Psora testacea]
MLALSLEVQNLLKTLAQATERVQKVINLGNGETLDKWLQQAADDLKGYVEAHASALNSSPEEKSTKSCGAGPEEEIEDIVRLSATQDNILHEGGCGGQAMRLSIYSSAILQQFPLAYWAILCMHMTHTSSVTLPILYVTMLVSTMQGHIDFGLLGIGLAVLGCSYMILDHYFGVTKDLREPPLVPSKIPWFGHLIGIIGQKSKYLVKLKRRYPLPIMSLAMPGGKMYIASSPETITAVQRHSKTLQFAPFAAKSHRRLFGTSKMAEIIVLNNIDHSAGPWGLWHDALGSVHKVLESGEGLDQMNRIMIRNVANSIEALTTKSPTGLMKWLKHELTFATTEAVYGPENPFQDSSIEQAFWDYEDNIMMVLANIFPNLTARKAFNGRETTVKALKIYFGKDGHEQGSYLEKALRAATMKYRLSLEDTARFELSNVIAILVNTVPTCFWMMFHIFSDPLLLSDLRSELDSILVVHPNEEKSPHRILDVNALKDQCPLLNSTWQETLRYRANGSSNREVMQDTVLDDRYLLKKGSVIQMPALVVHADTSVWGPSATQFDPRRFLAPVTKGKQDQRQHPGAFRAFGGGATLCPGRHFARTEILALVAMLVVRFDIKGPWPVLPLNDRDMAAAIVYPGEDTEIEVAPRKGFESGSWAFQTGPSKKKRESVAD